MGDMAKLIVAKGFKNLPKVQIITQSGHTVPRSAPPLSADKIHSYLIDHREPLLPG